MKYFLNTGRSLLLVGGIIGLVLYGCRDEIISYGKGVIYMPQAAQSGGVNNIYNVPSGEGPLTYNIRLDSSSGKLIIDLGIMRSGSFKGEDFSVDVIIDSDATEQFVASGEVSDALALPSKSLSLPSNVSVKGNKATFEMSVDYNTIVNNFSVRGKNLVLAVGLANPTRYELSDKNTLTMLVIDVDAVRDMFYKPLKDFLYTKGDKLMLNGEEYKGVGIYASTLSLNGCAVNNEVFSDSEIDSLFASFPASTMVRFQALKGFEDNTDKIIKSAEKHHIKLVLSLLDAGLFSMTGCGYFSMTPDFFENGYRDGFLDYVIEMAKKYKNSSAVAVWEIADRPSNWMFGGDVDKTYSVMKPFYQNVAKAIKLVDPNHLVATGLGAEFEVGTAQTSDRYEDIHNSPYIDVGTMWDMDWNQTDSYHIDAILGALQDLNKPLIVTGVQFNNLREGCDLAGAYNDDNRAELFKSKVNYYLDMEGVSIVFASSFVKDDLDKCDMNFDPDDPLYNAAMEFLDQYFK